MLLLLVAVRGWIATGSKATEYSLDISLLESEGDWRQWDIATQEWSGSSDCCSHKAIPRNRAVCSGSSVVFLSSTQR